MTATSTSKRPAATLRAAGGLKATIWQNETTDGKVTFNTTFTRSYRKPDDSWHETTSFGQRDILPLSKLLFEVDTKISELLVATKNQQTAGRPATRPEQNPQVRRSRQHQRS